MRSHIFNISRWYLPCHLFFFLCATAFADRPTHPFDTLSRVDPQLRTFYANRIFREHLFPDNDSSHVLEQLRGLKHLSEKLDDPGLKLMADGLKAIYWHGKLPDKKQQALDVLTDARKTATLNQNKQLSVILSEIHGLLFLRDKKYAKGFELLLQADQLANEIGYDSVPDVARMLFNINVAYDNFSNYERAIHYAKLSARYSPPESQTKILATISLGTLYEQVNEIDSALFYGKEGLKLAHKRNDPLMKGIANLSLGDIHLYQLGEPVTAAPYLQRAYGYCSSILKQPRGNHHFIVSNTIFCLLSMANVERLFGNLDSAEQYIQKASELIKRYKVRDYAENALKVQERYFKTKAAFYKASQNFHLGNVYLDSLLLVKDSIKSEFDPNMLAELLSELATEKYEAEMKVMEQEKREQRVIQNAVTAISILVFLMLGGIVYGLIFRARKQRKIMQLEIEHSDFQRQKAEGDLERAEEKLKNFRTQLGNYINTIREKNLLIEKFQDELERKNQQNPETLETIKQLNNAMILTDDDWISFKKLFESAYPGFMQKIALNHPELSASEIRIMSLIKLSLSHKEMANMLGISPESVIKTRQRVRRKLGLESHKEIPVFVKQI